MRYVLFFAVLLLLASLLTGVTLVRPGERAVVRRFGRVLEEKPRPGLLIGLPWGMDQVDRVPVDLVRRVTVGFEPQAEEGEESVPAGQLLTGDQNLVNVRVEIHYSVIEDQVVRYVVQRERVDDLVARAAETVLTEWAAGKAVDDILLNGKADLPEILVRQTQDILEDYDLGIKIRDASVPLLAPPEAVKPDFDRVNEAQTNILTTRYKEEEKASQVRGEAETEGDRIGREAEAEADEQLQQARTDAANFFKRLREYRKFLAKHPGGKADYYHDLWFNEMKKVRARLRAKGGRIEPLDKLLGPGQIEILLGPSQEKKR
jgi:membrane protease subunit HflK